MSEGTWCFVEYKKECISHDDLNDIKQQLWTPYNIVSNKWNFSEYICICWGGGGDKNFHIILGTSLWKRHCARMYIANWIFISSVIFRSPCIFLYNFIPLDIWIISIIKHFSETRGLRKRSVWIDKQSW